MTITARILGGSAFAAAALASTAALADISITYPKGWESLMEPAFEAFEAATGEAVEATVVSKDLDQRINRDFAGGTASDVVVYDSYRTSEYTGSGYLADLNGHVAGWETWEQYFGSLKDISTIDGTVRGIPVYTDVRMLWYNRDILSQAGIELPWIPESWQDILDAAEAIKAEVPQVAYPLYMPVGTALGEATTMQGFYMALLGADTAEGDRNRLRDRNEGKWIADSPAIRKVLGLYRDIFVERELSSREIYYSSDVWGDMRRAFARNDIGIMANGSWEFAWIYRSSGLELPPPEERLTFMSWAPFPGDGSAGAPDYANISGGWNLGINADADDKALAWTLVETILASERYTDWVVEQGRVAVRRDTLASPAYQGDVYLAQISPMVEATTGRDTYPGYAAVSSFVQQATDAILDGASVDEVVEAYRRKLIDAFGEENVKTID